jgi:putative SOS response-associated peptidase YedK
MKRYIECMCGRYTITTPTKELAAYFKIFPPSEPFAPTADARPSQNLPIVLENEPKQMVIGHWGYPIRIGGKEKELINIRAESILEKPMFQRAAKNHRCIILADGFFEWKKTGGTSQKYRFTLERRPMAFAGIYQWKSKKLSDEVRPFFSIITVPANKAMSPIHDRMPFIIPKAQEQLWLSPDFSMDMLAPSVERLSAKKV